VILDLWGLHLGQETLNLKGLKCLRSLCLHNIGGLDRVEGLQGLKNLSYFKWLGILHYCGNNTETRIGQFPASLRVLHIKGGIWLGPDVLAGCNNFRKLTLSWIQANKLDLSDCLALQSVQLLFAHVRKLQFKMSGSITGRCAPSLQSLEVSGCQGFADIPGLDQLIGLERLVLSSCLIKELPDLQNLTKLQVLELDGPCLKRKGGLEVGGYCIPPQPQELKLWRWGENELPNLNYGLKRLQVLVIHGCPSLGSTHLEGLGGLPALRRLTFHWCNIFLRLPDLTESRNLEELTLSGCQMRLCEEDICMLASLPLLQPVIFMGPRGYQYKLDVVREESDLGIPPILIVIGDNGVRCCRVTTRMNTGRPGG
jgi:Leucine-rich repeat (LRR) protein